MSQGAFNFSSPPPEETDQIVDRMQQAAHVTSFEEIKAKLFAGQPVTAEAARDEAIARVENNANQDWLDAFRRALERVARGRLHFNTDPVWEEFEREYPQPKQHEPRAAGAVVVKAMRDGVISPTDMFWASNRKSCHKRPLRVYRSLIFDGELDDGSLAH